VKILIAEDDLTSRFLLKEILLKWGHDTLIATDGLEALNQLQGIIPICMHCHEIRNDNQAWDQLEAYITDHSDAQFSHSLCPDCMRKFYPDLISDGE